MGGVEEGSHRVEGEKAVIELREIRATELTWILYT